jgi:DNA invertase Pin-like site-specific DNA recombinase
MKAYSIDLRKKIVQSVKKGISKSETARRFDVNRSTVGRYTPNMAIIVRVKRLLNTTHKEIVAVY